MSARFIAGIATVVGFTLAWAAWVYVKEERAHRSAWTGDVTSAPAQPYRSSARGDSSRAPGLVRLTAFLCLWVGELVAAVMIVPTFFMRPVSTSMSANKPGSTVSAAMLVYTLGHTILARHLLIDAHVMTARSLLHIVAGALAVFSAFGLAARGELPSLFYILLAIAAVSMVLSVLLSRMLAVHGAAFRPEPDD